MRYAILLCLLPTIVACPQKPQQPSSSPSEQSQVASSSGKQHKPDGKPRAGNLASVLKSQQLRVITPESKGFLPRSGMPLSFEREMAQKLAEELGVELQLVHPPAYKDLLPWLEQGRGDIVVAGLTATEQRSQRVEFTTPYQFVREVVIGPADSETLTEAAQLAGKKIVVRPSSSFWQTLEQLKQKVPQLQVQAAAETLDTQTLLEQVASREIPFTVADSNLAQAVASYSDIKVVFELTEPRPLGWALQKNAPELQQRVNAFLAHSVLTPHKDKTYSVDLDGIKKRKVLRVLTRNNAVNYWLHRGQEVGFEYELAKAFAKHLKVRLEMVIPPKREDLIPWLLQGKGDLIAASLTVTEARKQQVDFAAPNFFIKEVLLSRAPSNLKKPEDLAGTKVHIQLSTPYRQTLERLSAELTSKIDIVSLDEQLEYQEIIRQLLAGDFAATVSDSNVAELEARFHDDLVLGPELTEERPLAWALKKKSPKLKAAVDAFFSKGDYKPRGLMYNILRHRYFGDGKKSTTPKRPEKSQVAGQISPYDGLIKKFAGDFQLDWRLLAAQMYQESGFDPEAKSWVGALGLMQIMPATAKELAVGDVRKPEAGIHGGAKYMKQLIDRFEKTLPFRQRYRFALASYNAGKGHVDDARRLARQLKLDPDRWFGHTEKAMLLLEKPKYSRRARYGYCRGSEPVAYVSKIQSRFEAYSEFAKE